MAVATAVSGSGICKTDAERISVSKSWTATAAGSTAAQADSAVKSVTKNLRLAYANTATDRCNITAV